MRDLVARALNRLRKIPDPVASREVKPDPSLSNSELGKLFFKHRGRTIWKWVHYLDHYDRHFAAYKGEPRFLEIGVWKGGSLELWRDYFGPDATIFGIDIDPACAKLVDEPNRVQIGPQGNASFLTSVVLEMGGVDIVLDDGSHRGKDQTASFETLFPLLSDGGLYVIEDLHTSYWPGFFRGGYRRKGTGIELVKSLVDDMHGAWHKRRHRDIGAIHLYDSIVFIEKRKSEEPKLVKIGG